MKYTAVLAASFLVLGLAACDNDPSKGKTQASTSAPIVAAPAAATPAAAAAVNYNFSNADSKLEFVAAKVTRKHDGSFQTFTGTVKVVDNDLAKSSLTAEVDIASIKADDEKLTGHLKTPDLLDAAKYPKATFTSTSIKAGGDKDATHTVTGNLQLHGVTKSITFPAKLEVSGDTFNGDAEFAINRKEFGVLYPGLPDDLIKDDVLLKLHIRAHGG